MTIQFFPSERASIGVEMPIAGAVNRILADQSAIDDEVRGLLSRPLKHET